MLEKPAHAATPSSVLTLFETQVSATPHAVAVVEPGAQLSYHQLQSRIEQVAGGLQAAGIGPGHVVGLLLPRSIDGLVAMFGVLKAGAGYLPIDLNYPPSRIDYMLRNCGAGLALTSRSLPREHVSSLEAGFRFVDIADVQNFSKRATAPTTELHPDSLAYVIYTSGSTGTPKGVQIPHRALHHYVQWARNYYVGGAAVDMPLFSSMAFDLTVTSIYLPLVTGGKVVVYPELKGPRDLSIYRVIKDNQVDMIKLTPSHLALVGRMDLSESRVRKLILGGEDLKVALAERIYRAFGERVEIYNEYGPTEATVGCMEYRYDPELDRSGSVPIGKAIEGAEILVLDEQGQAVAAGETGEIHIGGPGLATGYANQPEATRARFVAHPRLANRIVYRTGDLARTREDGSLEYLGRKDRQVKIGGIRIELGEVESVLEEHPGVQSAAVTVYTPITLHQELLYCARCALPSNYPGVSYDHTGLCNVCRDYDLYKDRAQSYFRSLDDLREIMADAKASRKGKYDCMMLLSGGKDSSYVLYQLLAMDLKVLAYTLDNGYISDSAKDNVRRIVSALGVDHIFGTTGAMDAIFRASLEQFSNVCNGCFKTIYTLSAELAHQEGIKYIVTGLSRGQLFETRLDFLFRNQVFDISEIERDVQRARRVYHARNDLVARNLPQGPLDPSLLADIQFIDFFRYADVDREKIMAFLEGCRNWTRPTDTGRSTNCLINDVGIFVHNRERGFHNYALPYCWDVRLGLLDRDEAILELGTLVNMESVTRILSRIDYTSSREFRNDEPRLVAYYVPKGDDSTDEIRRFVETRLPAQMVPHSFVRLDELPLTVNGKIDWEALPAPQTEGVSRAGYVAAKDTLERTISEIWQRLLGVSEVGVQDNFFDLGGTSLLAVLLYTELEELLDAELPDPVTDEGWTIAEQALLLREHGYRENL